MVFFNYALRKLNAKIVYYGPGLCGKTTNLQWIHDHFEGGQRGKMISLSTEGDRTIFFDLLPLDIGSIRGMDVTLQLYTVPGQVHYNATRQLVLRGADGVVFVADSQATMRSSNVESLRNLEENLSLQGVELESFPHVLQFNKRDLADLISVEDLDRDINTHSMPFFEAIAIDGVGVQETLEGIVKLVMRSLRERYEPVVAAGPRPAGQGVPIDLEVPPPEPFTPAPQVAPPYEPPAMAEIPAEPVGLQDDVPTGVYAEGHPLSDEEDDRGMPGAAFWDAADKASGPTFGESESGFGPDEPTGSANFGFAMPFADKETTTDVTEIDDGDAQPDVETLLESIPEDDAPGDVDDGLEYRAPESPFEVADLTPAPFTADSVFGGPEDESESATGDEPETDLDEPEPVAVDPWNHDTAHVDGEGPSFEGASADDPEEVGAPSPATGTVDDLVASVLGADVSDSIAADPESVEDESEPGWTGDEAEDSPDLEWSDETADDEGAEWREETVDGVEAELSGDGEIEDAEHAEEDAPPAEVAAAEPDWTPPDDGGDEPLPEGIDASEDEPVDDWNEAHTDEIQIDEASEDEPLSVEAEAVKEAVYDLEVDEGAPFTSGPFTYGDGDPFGDETDDQTTPVRAIVEPQVSLTAPIEAGTALFRPGDNQLQLRLQGTGAIAESGQVRALDIEVPVPGSWVGNRRVTLQLRLTLSPVPEDEDGGQGDAP